MYTAPLLAIERTLVVTMPLDAVTMGVAIPMGPGLESRAPWGGGGHGRVEESDQWVGWGGGNMRTWKMLTVGWEWHGNRGCFLLVSLVLINML